MNVNNMEQDREIRRERIEQRRNEQRSNVQDGNRKVNIPTNEIQEKIYKLANTLKSKQAVTEDDLQTLHSLMTADRQNTYCNKWVFVGGSINEIQEKIYKLANTLKSKQAVTEDDLQTLHSLMTADRQNINTFLHVGGSLRGLVGELTGSCVNKQLWSASILCTVTASAPRVACRAAAYYLVLTLDSCTEQLTVYGAYCLGNLASDANVCKVLVDQGALTKLLEMLQKPTAQHVKRAVLSAVIRFVSTLKNDLSLEHLTSCMAALPMLDFNNTEVARCLALVTCHSKYILQASQDYALLITDLFIDLLELHKENCKSQKDCGAVYMARALANTALNIPNSNTMLSLMLSRYAYVHLARILSVPNHLHQACNWALGNIYRYCNSDDMKHSFHHEMVMITKQANRN